MKFQSLADTFACYSFSGFEALAEQPFGEPSFVSAVSGDYSLIASVNAHITQYHEVEVGWKCLVIDGEMPFELTGIAASVTTSLASAEISVLVMSGYKTDYFFIKSELLEKAVSCLREAGHDFPS